MSVLETIQRAIAILPVLARSAVFLFRERPLDCIRDRTWGAHWLGYGLLPAVVVGSLLASHTLLGSSLIRKLGGAGIPAPKQSLALRLYNHRLNRYIARQHSFQVQSPWPPLLYPGRAHNPGSERSTSSSRVLL